MLDISVTTPGCSSEAAFSAKQHFENILSFVKLRCLEFHDRYCTYIHIYRRIVETKTTWFTNACIVYPIQMVASYRPVVYI